MSPSFTETTPARKDSGLIKWDLAAKVAAKTVPAGPTPPARTVQEAVAAMRHYAEVSVDHVHQISGLEAARDLRDAPVVVVDRASWAAANAMTFRALLEPAMTGLAAKYQRRSRGSNDLTQWIGSRATAAETGVILGFLSTKVLGQYDPYAGLVSEDAAQRHPGGRLMIVAPNILEVEQELNVDPDDFRLWVCLHEQTHRVQFAAAPWLRDHMAATIQELSTSMTGDLDQVTARLNRVATAVAEQLPGKVARKLQRGPAAPSHQRPDDLLGPMSAVLGARERELMSNAVATMSLLEGHANWVMDNVDASVVSSVKTIRRRFDRRRDLQTPLQRILRKVLGLEAKAEQYVQGQKFVTEVIRLAGRDGFNRVWESAQNLPTPQEIHQPQAWVDRVLT
ncbi:zinc-dependent metalloprotease [Kocuria sp.]|uniref:zinc-dependent metalloprotease n=1 Tax=Kocuria sp. TaxID=1871328 RepID=UPI0026DEE393|nr:zinc-dependent metalloprotease [Kocuria sp.]MDO5617918.1 zinc-dependent metalloprotease [Kocuria sp.]